MDLNLLRAIANADAAGATFYATQAEGMPLVQAQYAVVNGAEVDPNDGNKRGMHITEAGAKYLAEANGGALPQAHTKPVSAYAVIGAGIELPKVKRGFQKGQGGGGAPSKYPFDTMDVGSSFFVPNTDVKNGDAVKTLGSAAGSANQRFAKPTGEKETIQRAKRGADHKAVKGPDGKNVMETVEREKHEFTRKFVVRPVTASQVLGNWTAPANGAIVQRTQ